jgi:hypothetical protein
MLQGVEVSSSSTLYARIFCMNVILAAYFLVTCTLEKVAKNTFVQKTRAYKVDEIDRR